MELETRFELRMSDDMHEALRRLAFENKTSIAEEIRKAIAEYLQMKEDQRK